MRVEVRGALLVFSTLLMAGCGGVTVRQVEEVKAQAPAEVRWTVTTPDGPLHPHVSLCWLDGMPSRLIAPSAPAQEAVESIEGTEGVELRAFENGWVITNAGNKGCVQYALDWSWTAWRHQDPNIAITIGDDVVVGADMLFLRLSPRRARVLRKVRFDTGPVQISAPFIPLDDNWRALPLSTFTRQGFVALGRFTTQRLPVAGGIMELAVLDDRVDVGTGVLNRWVYEAGRASAQLHGELPLPFIQVLVTAPPVALTSKPVLFGMATRGGGAGVNVVMSPSPEAASLVGDWVAVHELAHHGLPYLVRGERWISEGMATYYQFILRIRSAVIEPAVGWADLLQGARTAAAGPRSSYRWLYWGGAMGALRADVQLRVQSGGAWSLDRALSAFRRRNDLTRRYEASEVVRRLDELTQTDTFSQWQQARAQGDAFAQFESLFVELGIEAGLQGNATLHDHASLTWVRKAIGLPVLP